MGNRKERIGLDSEKRPIFTGDKVEVIEEEERRQGRDEYAFCSRGKTGVAVGGILEGVLVVRFQDGQIERRVGCNEKNLRKLFL